MNKDMHVIKILNDLGLVDEIPLSDDEEYIFKYATDPDFKHAEDIKKLFTDNTQPREHE